MLRAFLAIQATTILFAATDTQPMTEPRLIGTWEITIRDPSAISGTPTITYRPDHMFLYLGYGELGAYTVRGHWQLQGQHLIMRYGNDPVERESILTALPGYFTTRMLDGTLRTYKRIKPKR
jgi:hypothetical protein